MLWNTKAPKELLWVQLESDGGWGDLCTWKTTTEIGLPFCSNRIFLCFWMVIHCLTFPPFSLVAGHHATGCVTPLRASYFYMYYGVAKLIAVAWCCCVLAISVCIIWLQCWSELSAWHFHVYYPVTTLISVACDDADLSAWQWFVHTHTPVYLKRFVRVMSQAELSVALTRLHDSRFYLCIIWSPSRWTLLERLTIILYKIHSRLVRSKKRDVGSVWLTSDLH